MTGAETTLRLLIVDDHPAFREGIRTLLTGVAGLQVVGEAADGTAAIQAAAELQPDVVVLDLHMPGMNGIDVTRRIVETSPHIAVLILTMFEDDDSVFAALRAGALGYLLKGADRDSIVHAVSAVGSGHAIYSPAIGQRILRYFANAPQTAATAFPQLTDREREVLNLIAAGRNNATIAATLLLSPKTVQNHISNIFSKLRVADRAHAIVLAREAGLGRE